MEKPKVVIDNLVYRKIMHWVNKSSNEVSGLGTLTLEEGGIFRVTSALMLPQRNGAAHTDIEPEDVNKLLFETRNEPGNLRFWWHSHVQMSVFWSGTDMDTIKKLGAHGWFLSTVFNQKNEMRSAYYSFDGLQTPFGNQSLFLDELETQVEAAPHPDATEWDEEYTKNVLPPKAARWDNWRDNYMERNREWYDAREWDSDINGWRLKEEILSMTGGKRPPGVSKREWKKLKRTSSVATAIAIVPEGIDYDDYGFDQTERTFMAKQGWSQETIDYFFQMDVAPADMLLLAEADLWPIDVEDAMEAGWSVHQIMTYVKTCVENNIPPDPAKEAANATSANID